MKTICVIPARKRSVRFPNKPLASILGKPMIWWVFIACKKVREFQEIYIATECKEIKQVCEKFGANVILTSEEHDTATDRLYEVSTKIEADLYVMVNGDEPVINEKAIEKCIPSNIDTKKFFACNLMTNFENINEVIDTSNLKIVTNKNGKCLFISRSPIPFPKGSLDFNYKKFVGVGAFTKKALTFYNNTPKGPIETIEENDSFRFIENNMDVFYYDSGFKSLSVDTPKDISSVEKYLNQIQSEKETNNDHK